MKTFGEVFYNGVRAHMVLIDQIAFYFSSIRRGGIISIASTMDTVIVPLVNLDAALTENF